MDWRSGDRCPVGYQPVRQVYRWRKRFFERRLKGLEDAPRSGRPRVFSPLGARRDQSAGLRTARHHRGYRWVAVEFLGAG